MKVMVIHRGEQEGELDMEYVGKMQAYIGEVEQAGIAVSGHGLHPSAMTKRVKFGLNGVYVIDGPFSETREVLAGYSIWEVESMEQAVEWVKKMPMPDPATLPEGVEPEIDVSLVWEWGE